MSNSRYFANIAPTQDSPESAERLHVQVIVVRESADQSSVDVFAEWDLPTQFTHRELLRTFDKHRLIAVDGGTYSYMSAVEAFDSDDLPGMRFSVEVIPFMVM